MQRFHPKLLDTLKTYNRQMLGQDISAGVTVGVLALPLAMAFAMASGASPAAGIWTAIVAGFLISVFGGSRVQIGGPTGAFIPILYAIVAMHGLDSMLAATFMAGVLLVLMGASGIGSMIRYIPISVVIGFTNGIAVVIFLTQIPDFLGLQIEKVPAEFFGRMEAIGGHLHTIQWVTTLVAVGSVATILLWEKLAVRRVPRLAMLPAPLVALFVATIVCALFNLPVETIGSRFHGIPQGFPQLRLPFPSLDKLGSLLTPAITIALLGAIESLLSARVADARIDDKHNPNQELMGQGIANMLAPFFGGIAATGAIARTSTNVRAGGRTPIAGVVHALVLLLIVLVAAPLAAYVPIAALAAIVVVIAVRMGEWHEFRRMRRFSWNYTVILLTTFALTVLFDLTVAVEIGMVLSSLLFISRMQNLTLLQPLAIDKNEAEVQGYALRGALFFGAVAKLDALFDTDKIKTRVVIFDMHAVLNIDTSGIDWLRGVQRALARQGTVLVLCGLSFQPKTIVMRSGLGAQVERANIRPSMERAMRRANDILDGER